MPRLTQDHTGTCVIYKFNTTWLVRKMLKFSDVSSVCIFSRRDFVDSIYATIFQYEMLKVCKSDRYVHKCTQLGVGSVMACWSLPWEYCLRKGDMYYHVFISRCLLDFLCKNTILSGNISFAQIKPVSYSDCIFFEITI